MDQCSFASLAFLLCLLKAAWGGGLLMSQLHREGRFDGVERADSLTWNPHKLLGALLQCATFHLKEKVRPPLEGKAKYIQRA